jgi:hypothetical protein
VERLIHRGDEAGDVIVNLHAQLNMLGGLMVLLLALAFVALRALGASWPSRRARIALAGVAVGVSAYYVSGIAFSALEASRVADGGSFATAVRAVEPWQALVAIPAALAVLVGFAAYSSAVWRMTARQRAANRAALAAAPGLYAGKIPNRVRRRSPAALAGYELPLGLMGFPGVGWLFAGFPLTASVLLMIGPAITWAAIPVAFSPYSNGPLRSVGWTIELAWLPGMALVSSALLYRAHARRRLLLDGPPPPPPRPKRVRSHSGYRTRVGVALGTIALLLVSLPFVPAVAGIGGPTARYSHEPRLTKEVTGQFVGMRGGPVKLFSWSDPQGTYPADALRVHSRDVGSLIVRAAAVDRPAAYQLFDLGRGGRVALAVRQGGPTQLVLAPRRALRPGRYAFVASHEGMFGGRDFDYVTVVAPGAPVTAISTAGQRTAPQVADALLPLAAALMAVLFAARLGLAAWRRPAGQKLLWAAGFGLFGAAAAAEAFAHRSGWSPGLFRLYYLAGGVLTVAYLGAGSAWMLLPRRLRDVMVGALVLATLAAAVTVALSPVHGHLLAAAGSGHPPVNSALAGHAFLWAIALNSFGTLFLVGGSLYSIVRRRRVRTNLWIGGGAIVVGLATGLSRGGDYSFVYAGELVGIALMFFGFTFAGRPARTAPAPRVEPAPV